MNSCGSTCRIFWSAGIATALAASMTCSTSPWLTSLSRTPTTPWELRLLTWEPAMPANTEWISQPAMSSASSTARWIDCTVDSMLTTTPFFRPREGCEPRPKSSIDPSSPTSPTSATTFEVPMSRPTMRLRSARLSIVTTFATGHARGGAAPADGKPVRVTHVHVGNLVAALRDELQRGAHEFLEALVHLAPPEPHGDAVGQIEFPGAARIEAQRREPQPRLRQSPLGGEITLRHHRLLAFGTLEPRELGRNVVRVRVEELTARVEEAVLAPARCGALLDDQHGKSPRPGPLDTHRLHPRELMDGAAHRGEVHREQAHAVQRPFHRALDVDRRDALEAPGDRDRLDRLIERPRHGACERGNARHRGERESHGAPVGRGRLERALGGSAAVPGSSEHDFLRLTPASGPALRGGLALRRGPALRSGLGRRGGFRLRGSLGSCRARGPTGEAGLEHTPHQLIEIDADGARRHRHQAVARHARNGVDLEQQGAPGRVHHEIRPPPARGARRLEGRECEARQVRLGARREARGAEVAGVVAEVLRLVVVEHSRGLDTDRGQRLILEDRDGVLRARNTPSRSS